MSLDQGFPDMRRLTIYLANAKPGRIVDVPQVEDLVARCWDEFCGDDGGMRSEKLFGRTEGMSWSPPLLTFAIERHGGTVMGSTRAELQQWTLNVNEGTRTSDARRYRQLQPRQPALNVRPLAEQVARVIADRQEDPRLKWHEDGRARVYIGKIIPDHAAQRTVTGRRKRFWNALDELLVADWTRSGQVYTPRNTNVESKT